MAVFSNQSHSPIFNYQVFSFFPSLSSSKGMPSNFKCSSIIFWFLVTTLIAGISAQHHGQLKNLESCGSIIKAQFDSNALNYRANTEVQSSIQSTFPADKNLLIEGLIAGNSTKVRESIKGNEGKYVVNIGIVGLLGLLLLILVPVLLFTKFCHCIKYCKAKDNQRSEQGYSSCEKKWPIILTLVLLLALIGLCAAILKINTDFEPKYNDFKCSIHVLTDNLLQGTSFNNDTIRFLGLNNYKTKFKNFFNTLNEVKNSVRSNLSSKSKPIRSIRQYFKFLQNSVEDMPLGPRLAFKIEYSNPLTYKLNPRQSNPREKSIVVPIIGNTTAPGSLIYNLSISINESKAQTETIVNFTDIFIANLTKIEANNGNIVSAIDRQVQNVKKIQTNVEMTTNVVEKNVLKTYAVGSYVVIAFCIAICVGLAIAILFLFWKKIFLCRIPIYICCGLLWVIGILFFVIGIAFVISNPGVLYGCQYLRQSFSSPQNYNKNILALNPGSNQAQTIGKCLSSSVTPEYFYNQIVDQSILTNISEARNYLSINFDGQSQAQDLNDSFQALLGTVIKYRDAEVLDFDNESMIEEVRRVSLTEACFPDSWVPSHKSKDIKCQVSGKDVLMANHDTCNDFQDFKARAQGCTGCIDMVSLFGFFSKKYVNEITENLLKDRYKKCYETGRQQVIKNLSMVWDLGFSDRVDKLNIVKSEVTKSLTNIRSAVKTLNNSMGQSHKKAIQWLKDQNIFEFSVNSSVKDSMNCKVLGKGIETSVNILCSSGIPYVYNLRFLYPIAGTLVLLLCGFITFLLHRHSVQLKYEKKQKLEKQLRNNDQIQAGRDEDSPKNDENRESNEQIKGGDEKIQQTKSNKKSKKSKKSKDDQKEEEEIEYEVEVENVLEKTAPASATRLSRQIKNFSYHN